MIKVKGNPKITNEQIYSILMNYETSREGIITQRDCDRAIRKMVREEGYYNMKKADKIYDEFLNNHELMESQKFKLEMLVGHGAIISYREIEDISPYNSNVENKPDNINVFEFDDGSFFAMQKWGDGECAHINAYFYDSVLEKVIYDNLL